MASVSAARPMVVQKPPRPGAKPGRIYLLVQTRSVFACLLHWIVVAAVAALAVTGFYIADPYDIHVPGEAYQAYVMGWFRLVHFVTAAILIVAVGLRVYLAFTPSCNKDILQMLPTPWNVVHAVKLAWSYLTISSKHERFRFINPLGGVGVFMIALALGVLTVTGMLLYFPSADPGVWGGLAADNSRTVIGAPQTVRLIHHMAMYGLGFFVVIHIYMQLWKNSVNDESDLSSIIGGYKIFPLEDIGHFDDHYGIHLKEEAPTAAEMDEKSTPMKEGPGYH
jgi:Ni/Fe-hydrogenase 1 B-type cytochrome subunit